MSYARARVCAWVVGLSGPILAVALVTPGTAAASTLSLSSCHLAAPYQHVIYVQFDNTHLARDNSSVPSDLEQIPNLRNFLVNNGTLLNNDHTILISHTAGGIISSLTGLYPDRNGITASNTQLQYTNASGTANAFPSAFSYWTDPTSTSDSAFNLLTAPNTNTPAPWVPYTKAGCDVGAFSIANMELENTSTSSSGDITTVFGQHSPQAAFANWSNHRPCTDQDSDTTPDASKDCGAAVADFEGIALHCAQADSGSSGLCSSSNGGRTDSLPSEPGGYMGFNGLFGATAVNQVTSSPGSFVSSTTDDGSIANIGGSTPFADVAPTVNDVYHYGFSGCQYCAGGPHGPASSAVIADSRGNSGFPGFSPSAAQTLGYVASMQEAGIPVTFAYIADAHDDHSGCNSGNAMGPGQSCYEQQLAAYNQAFGAFFERLANDGITKANTLFVFTVDEGDHYAGGPPTNTCDGVTTACTYTPGTTGPNTVGEQDVNINNALAQETGNTTPFNIRFDDAPSFQVDTTSSNPGIPGPYDPRVRQLERDVSTLTVANQRTGQTDAITQHIADQADLSILHMINSDPLRTPSFVLFGNPDYFYQTGNCPSGSSPGCPVVNPGFAWNHGTDNPEIARTWVGYVGPTIQNLGQTGSVWTDHTDVRPTMLEALGLRDDYSVDGNAVTQVLDSSSLPSGLQAGLTTYQALAAAESQLNAPFGQFGHDSEIVSTTAAESAAPGDAVAKGFDQQLNSCRAARDALVARIQPMLLAAEFSGGSIDNGSAHSLANQAYRLIDEMHRLSQMTAPPNYTVCVANPAGSQG
jgi:hypothetical protein